MAVKLSVPMLLSDYIDPLNWSCGDCPTQRLTRYRHAVRTLSNGEDFELIVGNEVQFFYFGPSI